MISVLKESFGICRLESGDKVPKWLKQEERAFYSVTRTAEELSIVSPTEWVPDGVEAERGWRCLKVKGPLGFGEVGILLSLVEPLADVSVSIFAISTYDTDYLLLREKDFDRAIEALERAGHKIEFE